MRNAKDGVGPHQIRQACQGWSKSPCLNNETSKFGCFYQNLPGGWFQDSAKKHPTWERVLVGKPQMDIICGGIYLPQPF